MRPAPIPCPIQPLPDPPSPLPARPSELPEYRHHLETDGYRFLLADHCQLVDQVAALTVAIVALWQANRELRVMLDLPIEPMPLAITTAVAGRPVPPVTSGEGS